MDLPEETIVSVIVPSPSVIVVKEYVTLIKLAESVWLDEITTVKGLSVEPLDHPEKTYSSFGVAVT